jgi:hypothetical protein
MSRRYILKERLKATEKWIEYFLDVEKKLLKLLTETNLF